jgi:hypothetical protein
MSLVLKRDARRLDAAAADLEDAAQVFAESQRLSESLAHPKHAASLAPIRAGVERVLGRFFRRQQALLIPQISEHLKHVVANNKLIEREQTSLDAISYALPDGTLLPAAVTAGMAADYASLVKAAVNAGFASLANEIEASISKPSDTFIETYLREHSLEKLADDLNATTVTRLQNALADAYEDGASFEEMVQAIKDEYSDFSTRRASMIAQTGMNGAYNGGRKQLGLDLGFNEKSQAPGGIPCLVCVANIAQGWIGIEEEFESGDDFPPVHPNCVCSLDLRMNNDAEVKEGWVTINGQHIDIGDGAGLPLSKSDLAKLAYRGGTKAEQDVAEQTEHELSQALGMKKSPDNTPFDLTTKTVGVEVKTLTTGTNDKITMKGEAIARKDAGVKAMKLKRTYTVVVDKRPAGVGTSTGQTRYFVREGYGSFRVGSMTEVAGTAALSKFMKL